MADRHTAPADNLSDHIAGEAGNDSGEELVFLRNGLSQQTLKKLRRGHWVVQDELDLHGLTSAEARALIERGERRANKDFATHSA